MEIVELLLIILGVFAIVAISIAFIVRISSFYRAKYGFSIWSGVFIMLPIIILLLVASSSNDGLSIIIEAISLLLIAFTLVQDIRLAGLAHGTLGFLFQLFMIMAIFFIIIFALAGMLARGITKRTNRLIGGYSSTFAEARYGIILLPVFIRI